MLRRLLAPVLVLALLVVSSAPLAAAAGPTVDLVVTRAPGASASASASAERAAGATVVDRIPALDAEVIRVPASAAARVTALLEANPAIASVEADGRAHTTWSEPTDTAAASQWSLQKTGVARAWDLTTGSSDVVIAIIDTGVQLDHPDLAGQLLPGWDFVNGDADPTDDFGHGTGTSSMAAALTNNGIGVAGVCPGCRLLPVKVMDSNGSGSHSDIAAGIVWATDQGADVINLSIGGTGTTTVLADAVAYAEGHGVLVVAAAGNSGNTTLFYPAAYPGVVSVGGTDYLDQRELQSNYGAWVSIAAPFCSPALTPTTMNPSGINYSACGTSFSSPMVAGTAGLMISANPSATAADLRAALLATASVPVTDRYGATGPMTSSGRLDALAAVRAISGETVSPSPTTDLTAFPAVAPGVSIDVATTVTDVVSTIQFATTAPTSTLAIHLTSATGDFSFRMRNRSGGVAWMTDSTNGTINVSAAGWSKQPYTIEIRPTGASTVSVSGTVSVAPVIDPSPSASPSPSPSASPSPSPSASPSPSPSASPSPSPSASPSPDLTAPFVKSVKPVNAATKVTRNVRPVITFSETVRGVSASRFALVDLTTGRLLAFRIVASTTGTTSATIIPLSLLPAGHRIRVTVRTGIADLAGNALPTRSQAFTVTGDRTAPRVVARTPASGAKGVSRTATIKVRFSENVRRISTTTVFVVDRRTGRRIAVKFAFSSATHKLTIRHATFAPGRRYTVHLGSGITDAAGNPLATRSWTFTTRR